MSARQRFDFTSYVPPFNTIEDAMFLQRSAIAAARRAAVSPVVKRSFATSFVRRTLPNASRNMRLPY